MLYFYTCYYIMLSFELMPAAANRMLAIACFCIGTDQVDWRYANSIGIPNMM